MTYQIGYVEAPRERPRVVARVVVGIVVFLFGTYVLRAALWAQPQAPGTGVLRDRDLMAPGGDDDALIALFLAHQLEFEAIALQYYYNERVPRSTLIEVLGIDVSRQARTDECIGRTEIEFSVWTTALILHGATKSLVWSSGRITNAVDDTNKAMEGCCKGIRYRHVEGNWYVRYERF